MMANLTASNATVQNGGTMIRIFTLLFVVFGTQAFAADPSKNISCFDESGVIDVTLELSNGKATSINWRQSRAEATKQFAIISETLGSELWPSLPNIDSKAWPIGSYIGKLNGETTVLNIARPASAGGGGYQWEGILTYLTNDSRVLTWGMYCNQF